MQQNSPPANLPNDWTEHSDPGSGRVFYYNTLTGESAWERPKPQAVASQPAAAASAPQVQQAAQATSLPKDWTEHSDPSSGRTFFYNTVTGESSWEEPALQTAASQPAASAPVGQTQSQQPEVSPQEKAPQSTATLPKDWTENMDPTSGRVYYFNAVTGVSSWDRPQPEEPLKLETVTGQLEQQADQPASLPKDWTEHTDSSSGRKFFFNTVTKESSWEKPAVAGMALPTTANQPRASPLASSSLSVTTTQLAASSASPTPAQTQPRLSLDRFATKPPAHAQQQLPNDWTEHTDSSSGRKFFFNTVTKESSWERPVAADAASPAPVKLASQTQPAASSLPMRPGPTQSRLSMDRFARKPLAPLLTK
mmetsp:Transcript_46142/g.128362  ORF Transcript_46142/g.128362 Transcript_46142/m.128362 type:complete len:366 (+) Transcript_46142:162-1259(+)|eukprot:CAMPEP_0117475036 /NCGR_PEP_ID=MMETSP0784-20121206/9589_1 /TAXON_ID=39447 /ORGANISM="" /LENGTH=365 /DNA_ID=CAMNT_0005269273 /DNA_START=162 /DNA_END=1259 /DNA_ORIENTATION=+